MNKNEITLCIDTRIDLGTGSFSLGNCLIRDFEDSKEIPALVIETLNNRQEIGSIVSTPIQEDHPVKVAISFANEESLDTLLKVLGTIKTHFKDLK